MSAAEAPKSEQIQANVAAALSRLRGELGAASSPVASATPIPLPKIGAEPAPVEPMPEPLPAGPVRTSETTVVRPYEPILNAMSGNLPSNDSDPAKAEPTKPDLFGRLRADPSLTTDRAAAAAIISANEAKTDSQPDLLSGMEVPPAPPPPLGSFAAEDEVNGRGRRMRNRLLVLVAVLVIAGGAAWAWVSSHRAPEGPAPVITADASPEKVKPEDEGGMQVPNQNVQILDNMSGGQSTAEQQQNVMPPPEQPVSPPMTETTDQANAAPQAPAITDAPKPEPAPTAPAITDQAAPSVDAPAIPSVSAPEPSQTAAAPTPTPVVPEPQTQQAAPAPAEATPAAPATTAEKAPEPAPAAAAPKAAEPTQTAAAPAAATKPSVAPTAGGNARIQLAAVKSEALANAQWAKLQKAHPDLLGALTLNIQKVDKSGGSLYRIQAGPLSKAQAKDLCAKLKAQKQDCIVAK